MRLWCARSGFSKGDGTGILKKKRRLALSRGETGESKSQSPPGGAQQGNWHAPIPTGLEVPVFRLPMRIVRAREPSRVDDSLAAEQPDSPPAPSVAFSCWAGWVGSLASRAANGSELGRCAVARGNERTRPDARLVHLQHGKLPRPHVRNNAQ